MHVPLSTLFLSTTLALTVLSTPVRLSSRDVDTSPIKRNAWLNQFISDLLGNLPVVNGAIDQVTNVLTDFSQLMADVTGAQTTYNELGQGCKEWTIIFARGTTEPGNVGSLVGPPLFEALGDLVGQSLTRQGVNGYDATVEGYLSGGDAGGSGYMAYQISTARSICPNTKLIASGYSQGAMLVHNSIGMLPADTARWISSVLMFGDPYNGTAIPNVDASKVFTACHEGDNICDNGVLILPAHLTYAEDVGEAAAFAVAVA